MTTVPYIRPHHKMIESLFNDNTTIQHGLGDWVMDLVIESLEGNSLDVVYSIPTGTENPQLTDICAIHLLDPSGIIVTEKKEVSYSNSWEFIEAIEAMVKALPIDGFVVCIESLRDGVTLRNDVEINNTHGYLAIAEAFSGVMSTIHGDIFDKATGLPISKSRLQTGGIIDSHAGNRRNIEVTLDNGNRYKLLAIAKTDKFETDFACTTH